MEQHLTQYRIFYAVARAGNISRAAKELFISQPAISKSISKLEESLGMALFIRNSRGVDVTFSGFDCEIVETHHNQKVDAPSGTAKLLLDAVVEAEPEAGYHPVYGREGMCGARGPKEIGMHSLRGGTVAGVHEVSFFGQDEEVTLTHRATSRQIFVNGALAAAQKLVTREPGFYTFDKVMFA